MAAPSGGSSLHRASTNVYRRLLNFDSPLAAIGLDSVVPKGEEKLLKTSFYQAATMFILTFGLVGVYSLYLILSPFVKPILWAVLIGTVLHPLKLAVTHSVRSWLFDIGSTSTVPMLSFHIVMSPLTLTFSLLTYIRTRVTKYMIPLMAASFVILFLCAMVRYDFPLISNYFAIQSKIVHLFAAVWSILTLPWPVYLTTFLGYTIAAAVLPPHMWHPTILRILSFAWWALLFFLVSKILGPFSLLFFPVLFLPIAAKLATIYMEAETPLRNGENCRRPSVRTLQRASDFFTALSPRLSNLAASELRRALSYRRVIGEKQEKSGDKEKETESKTANIILMAVIWAVILVRLFAHPVLLTVLLPFIILPPLICYVTKLDSVVALKNSAIKYLSVWFESRRNAFLPPSIAKVGTYLVKGDSKIRKMFETCIEGGVTAILIVGVVAAFAFTIFFAAVQLHRESVYVFTMSNELLNRTLHPEVNRWLESTDMNVTALHEIATNAANFGRQFFNSTVDGWIHSVPDAHREQLKQQLLNAYDLMSTKFFETWSHDFNSTLHSAEKHAEQENEFSSFSSIFTSWFHLNFAGMMEIGMSIWAVLKENAGLFLAIFTHIASALLICSWAVFGYAVSSVVFLTTLYYLLMASGDTYKPVQLLISLTPFDDESNGSNIVGRAVDSGIRGVFIATFKMIIFYGLYTWFLHSLFEIGIAFLPSLCAAVLAAVPIVGAYWASLPGVFQLWLIADRGLAALFFLGLHMLPMYFVDVVIYGDIKGGGHPYLTGLAIVGGVSCLGFEGAILGPVLLCLIVILMNLYRGVLHASNDNVPNAQTATNETATSTQAGPTPSVHQISRRLQGKSLVASTDLVNAVPPASNAADAPSFSTTSLSDQANSAKEE